MTSADLNADGRIDLIIDLQGAPSLQGHYIQLLVNRGPAGFVDETPELLPQPQVLTGPWVHSMQAADFNGDGFVDLIARNGLFPPIFLNDGTGHFINLPGSFLDYSGWATPEGINLTAMDANGDGRMDLIADLGIGNSTIYLFTQPDPGASQSGTAGSDKLAGRAGADLFIDTKANLAGDTILDFARGDRIVITDATLGSSLTGSASAVTYGTMSFTMTNLRNASFAATAAPEGGVQIAYGGPALIVSAGAGGAAIAGAASQPLPFAPDLLAEHSAHLFQVQHFRLADDIFAVA